ncbi:MAG: hypothetical protein H0T73_00215 [Ardenticatenales bacterium]|nr:hypothetical protein [Ardenticatenales bacterium]
MPNIKIRLQGLPKDVDTWAEFLRALGTIREETEDMEDPENSYLVIRQITASLQPVESHPIDLAILEKLISYFRGDFSESGSEEDAEQE